MEKQHASSKTEKLFSWLDLSVIICLVYGWAVVEKVGVKLKIAIKKSKLEYFIFTFPSVLSIHQTIRVKALTHKSHWRDGSGLFGVRVTVTAKRMCRQQVHQWRQGSRVQGKFVILEKYKTPDLTTGHLISVALTWYLPTISGRGYISSLFKFLGHSIPTVEATVMWKSNHHFL